MSEKSKSTKIEDLGSRPVLSLRDLEYRLGEDRETLRALAKSWQTEYRPFQQPKAPKPFQRVVKSGKIREIDNPSKDLKRVQKKILKRLLWPVKLPYFLFGAVSKRDVKQHAEEHLGQKTVVKMDVKGYYPSVTSRHVYDVWSRTLRYSPPIARLLTQLTTYDWHLPQGAPTSPALANLFLASIYGPVLQTCSEMNIVPTAWVDDLIFSGSESRSVMELVRQTLAANGFKMSSKKRIILTGRDAKVITGIRLGAGRARAPKEKLRDIRAAIHKLEIGAISRHEREKYIASLKGRLNHIKRICSEDASRFISKLESVLSGPTTRLQENPRRTGQIQA
jgi:RNA-directed DNA polymerase